MEAARQNRFDGTPSTESLFFNGGGLEAAPAKRGVTGGIDLTGSPMTGGTDMTGSAMTGGIDLTGSPVVEAACVAVAAVAAGCKEGKEESSADAAVAAGCKEGKEDSDMVLVREQFGASNVGALLSAVSTFWGFGAIPNPVFTTQRYLPRSPPN